MMKRFHVEVPINPDGMIELFCKPDFAGYDAADFKIEYFTEAENDLLQNFVKRAETVIPILPFSRNEGNWFIHSADVKTALRICDDISKSCPEQEAAAVQKLRDILSFAEKDFKPVHFFTEQPQTAPAGERS